MNSQKSCVSSLVNSKTSYLSGYLTLLLVSAGHLCDLQACFQKSKIYPQWITMNCNYLVFKLWCRDIRKSLFNYMIIHICIPSLGTILGKTLTSLGEFHQLWSPWCLMSVCPNHNCSSRTSRYIYLSEHLSRNQLFSPACLLIINLNFLSLC